MTQIKLTVVPISAMSVKQLRSIVDPLSNTWCQHCSCPPEKQPCRKDKSPFTFEEIAAAIERKDFEIERNERWGYDNTVKPRSDNSVKCGDLCNRARHVRRIAYLASHYDGKHTIIMLNDMSKVYDGFHRLAAAIYLGLDIVQVRPLAEFDEEKFLGYEAPQER
jgi:hypothetical protein